MQKTYWWRITVILVGLILFGVAFVSDNQLMFGVCDNQYTTDNYQGCFDKSAKTIGEPLFFLSLSLLTVSLFLFFIRDDVFLKWFRFAVLWFIIAAVLIFLVPASSGGWGANLNPTKESVSIWMSSLFVIVSLAKIIWDTRKSKAVI